MRTLPPATTRDTVRFRQAAAGDSGTVARLHRATVRACLPFLPDLHTAEEDSAYFRDRLFRDCTVWVAEVPAGRAASIVGYCAFRPDWVDHLFVDPAHHGEGIGGALLDRAMAANDRLMLWVFQRNAAAISFYVARGFRLVRTTDGSDNEEGEPDALYAWSRSRKAP
ncbi:MAG: GNAT family N-acetyltransferase [Alphaproteobacteria bacterium]|nr:GNAT family N-acetyltransferase [Alphaproteobacteria bacterium]